MLVDAIAPLSPSGAGSVLRRACAAAGPLCARLRRWLEPVWGLRLPPADYAHNDLNLSNVLTDGTLITGVVDWDEFGLGSRALDLVALAVDCERRGDRGAAGRLLARAAQVAGGDGPRCLVSYRAIAGLAVFTRERHGPVTRHRYYHNDMDTYSLAAAARELGTSAPRVRRAVDRLGIRAERAPSGAFRLTVRQVQDLARELGVMPDVPELSRVESRVLAALSRSPRGVASVREAARRAGSSPTATARAVETLEGAGLVARTSMLLARGQATEATVYRVRFGAPEWLAIAPVIADVRLPARPAAPRATRVPPHLLHLFWNAAPAQLDVASSAPFIARRLITSFDPDGLAWGTLNLPAGAWEHAAATRGLEPAQRALALNLARSAPHAL